MPEAEKPVPVTEHESAFEPFHSIKDELPYPTYFGVAEIEIGRPATHEKFVYEVLPDTLPSLHETDPTTLEHEMPGTVLLFLYTVSELPCAIVRPLNVQFAGGGGL